MSGADLYTMNHVLKASIDGLNSINMAVLEYAKDKISRVPERKSAVITPETPARHHEAGHA
jgi:ATP-dependent Zn protease